MHEDWGGKDYREQNHRLLRWAQNRIAEEFPHFQPSYANEGLAMASFLIPQDDGLYDYLWSKQIEVVITPWKSQHILRISAFSSYNEKEDYEILITVLKEYMSESR